MSSEDKPTEMVEAGAPAATEPVATEPAAEPSKEPVEGASGALMTSIGAPVMVVLSLAILVLVVVGTPIDWAFRVTSGTSFYYTLWKAKKDAAGVRTETSWKDDTCTSRQDHYQAAESFAIVTIFCALVTFVLAVVARVRGRGLAAAGVGSVLVFAASLVTWGAGLRVYHYPMCGVKSLADQNFEVGPGAALFVTAWVLSIVGAVISFVDPKVPAVLPEAVVDRVTATVFTVAAGACVAFSTIATPIQIVYLLTDTAVVRATLWKLEVNGADTSFEQLACGDMERYSIAGRVTAVFTIGLCVLALVGGVVASVGKAGRGAMIVLGLAATLLGLITVGLDATLYYRTFCGPSLEQQKYQLAGGVALMLTEVLVMAVVTVVLIAVALSRKLSSGKAEGNTKWSAFVFLASTMVVLLFTILGASQYVFAKSQNDGADWHRVTWWRDEVKSGATYSFVDFTCSKKRAYLNWGGALDIASIPLTVIALVLGVLQLSSAKLRVAASGVLLVSSVAMLVSWVLGAASYRREFCGQGTYEGADFHIGTGLGLIVAAWCLSLVSGAINLAVSP